MGELDGWIEQLFECKQLAENSVKTLCEKVRGRVRVWVAMPVYKLRGLETAVTRLLHYMY